MQTSLKITFRHMNSSAAVEDNIRKHLAQLEHHFERIVGCHVVIDTPPAHRNKGGPFSVRIDLTVPGREIFVNSARDDHPEHADVYVAIRDAFEAVTRQLDNHMRRQRGEDKHIRQIAAM